MATRSRLLKLSKKELIKRCKKKKINIPYVNTTKSQLIDLLLKHNNQRTISNTKLSKINIIPYNNPNTEIKGVCKRLNNNVLLQQTRIIGAYKIRKNILIYDDKSQQFIEKYNIKFTQKYTMDRILIYGIDINQTKLFALFSHNAAKHTFKRLIEYNLNTQKWTEKHDLSITLNIHSKYKPYLVMTSDNNYLHLFRYKFSANKWIHCIWNNSKKKLKKCKFHQVIDSIFYDERYNILFMIDFVCIYHEKYGHKKVISINIYWLKMNDEDSKINWYKAKIDCKDEKYQFMPFIDQWYIVNCTYFVVFNCDDSIKYVDFIAMENEWRICQYELPEKFIIPPQSKFSTIRLFVTDDGIIHIFKSNDGKLNQYYKIKLKDIDQRLCNDKEIWMVLIYGFIFHHYQRFNYLDIVALISKYCFLSDFKSISN